jgi:hypothetical protein
MRPVTGFYLLMSWSISLATRNVCEIGWAHTVDNVDVGTYPSLSGFDVSPNKVLRVGGREIWFYTYSGGESIPSQSQKWNVETLIANPTLQGSDSSQKPNLAGFAFFTDVTNYGNSATSTIKGVYAVLKKNLVSGHGAGSANPSLEVGAFKMSGGVYSSGNGGALDLGDLTTYNNKALRLECRIDTSLAGSKIWIGLYNGLTQIGLLSDDLGIYNMVIGSPIGSSSVYTGLKLGGVTQYTQQNDSLFFLDNFRVRDI